MACILRLKYASRHGRRAGHASVLSGLDGALVQPFQGWLAQGTSLEQDTVTACLVGSDGLSRAGYLPLLCHHLLGHGIRKCEGLHCAPHAVIHSVCRGTGPLWVSKLACINGLSGRQTLLTS